MNGTISLIISIIIAFAVTAGLGFVIIPWLRKLKFGQTILDIGPSWHKSKQGTPNMGGLMFIIGITVSFIVTYLLYRQFGIMYLTAEDELLSYSYTKITEGNDTVLLFAGLLLAIGCGVVGFTDDFIKIKLKRNEGLTAKQKTFGQLIMTFGFILSLWLSHNTRWYIPFIGIVNFEKNIFTAIVFWLISFFIVYGCVNSVNLTDGIDGLCSSVTATVAVSFIIIGFLQNFVQLQIFSGALLGGVLGFLCWNWNPAKTFMGDTGSLFLGGMVVALSYLCKCPLILLPVGIIYVSETMSDIIQIGYFKITHGKRIFKMAPIHHHFELCGWSESRVVAVFTVVTAFLCVLALAGLN